MTTNSKPVTFEYIEKCCLVCRKENVSKFLGNMSAQLNSEGKYTGEIFQDDAVTALNEFGCRGFYDIKLGDMIRLMSLCAKCQSSANVLTDEQVNQINGLCCVTEKDCFGSKLKQIQEQINNCSLKK